MKRFFYNAILRNLALAFCLAVIFYVPEWIFQRTGNMPLSAFAPSLAWLSLSMGLFLFTGLFGTVLFTIHITLSQLPKLQRIAKIPVVAGVLTVTALMLVNNFTNTIWGVSISAKSGAPWVNHFRIGTLLVFAYAVFEMLQLARKPFLKRSGLTIATSVLAALSFLPAISYAVYSKFAPSGLPQKFTTSLKPEELPNILFLQGDGINAANMSIYGYERQTTPFLDSIKDRVNVWTNFYPSNCCTYGSHYALLTGISPLKHNIYYPPAQVPPEEASWSLPDILKSIGYKTYQDTVPYQADAYFMGLTNAFDLGNESWDGGSTTKKILNNLIPRAMQRLSRPCVRFMRRTQGLALGMLGKRVMGGLDHIATPSEQESHPDEEKVKRVNNYIEAARGPWFVQVHLLATHGVTFALRNKVFVDGRLPQVPWQTEFYDNAIRDWDDDVKKIIATLSRSNQDRETLVFVTSDHGMSWNSGAKIPLISFRITSEGIISPLIQEVNPIQLNALHESIDIPLTAVTQITNETPQWMTGVKLGTQIPNRIVISASELRVREGSANEFFPTEIHMYSRTPRSVNILNSTGSLNIENATFISIPELLTIAEMTSSWKTTAPLLPVERHENNF